MSTVLRPVGPLPRRIYWIRRSVLFGVILIVILLVATQCGGGGGGGGKNTGKKTGTTTPNPNDSTTPPTKPTVGPCNPHDLKVSVSTDTTTYTAGQAPTLTATLSNPTSSTCKLARSASNEIWTIKSGTPTVWTTSGCSADPVPAQAKLAAGATKQIHTNWPGKVQANCQDVRTAEPGEYRLYATIDGVKAAHPAIFHIIS